MSHRPLATLLALAALVGAAAHAAAQPAVFNGDPIDPSSGLPYIILPGIALVLPGPDGRFGGGDDIIDPSKVGDVDLVIRSGGGYSGGPIPAPASSVASARQVTAGGGHTGIGTELPFQGILSDGAASPPAGNPLPGHELDGRGLIAFAYGDLDGDGFIGPTSVDGNADNQIELQEVYAPVGRQVALFNNGVATGSIGVSVGAPASAGGLGVVLGGGAFTGVDAPSYADGSWIATRLPFMPPLDPKDIVGSNNIRPPDPEYLVDMELNLERIFLPAPNHPILGTPYALPLGGTNVTTDLARSESGPATGVAFAVPVDVGTFAADPARHLIPAVAPGGGRQVLEVVPGVVLSDDGPGNATTVTLYPADLFGNAADPTLPPMVVELEVGPGLRLLSPDTDGDPQHETVELTSAASVPIAVDDAGGAGDSGASSYLAAVVGGIPRATLRVTLAGGGGSGQMTAPLAVMRFAAVPGKDRLLVRSDLGSGPVDFTSSEIAITVTAGATVIYDRTFAAGTLQITSTGRRWVYRERGQSLAGGASVVLRALVRQPGTYRLRARIRNLDIAGVDAGVPQVVQTVRIGATAFAQTLTCAPNRPGNVSRCVP